LQADDERDTLRRRMERLNDRERAILALRFGLHGERLTLREVGARLRLSGERVRRIASSAIRKLGCDPKDGTAAARRNRRVVASIRKELASESSSGPDGGKKVTRSSSTTHQN
jgi:Sigma-70, region 4